MTNKSHYVRHYTLPQSPIFNELMAIIETVEQRLSQLSEDDTNVLQGVLDLTIKNRLSKIEYKGNVGAYIDELLHGVIDAKNYFNQCCYTNDHASDAFRNLQLGLITIKATYQN